MSSAHPVSSRAESPRRSRSLGLSTLLRTVLRQQAVHWSSSSGTLGQHQQATIMAADAGAVDERYSGTTFAIQEEDHTLANTLRFFLNKNPQVTFCGYSIPHPTEDSVNIRVQTTGEVTAAQALLTACEECSKVCKHIGNVFDAAIEQYQQEHPGGSQQQQDVDMAQ